MKTLLFRKIEKTDTIDNKVVISELNQLRVH